MTERIEIVCITSVNDKREVKYDPDLFSEETRVFWKKRGFGNITDAYITTRGLFLNSAQFSGNEDPSTKRLGTILSEISGKFQELIGDTDFKSFRVRQGWDIPAKSVK